MSPDHFNGPEANGICNCLQIGPWSPSRSVLLIATLTFCCPTTTSWAARSVTMALRICGPAHVLQRASRVRHAAHPALNRCCLSVSISSTSPALTRNSSSATHPDALPQSGTSEHHASRSHKRTMHLASSPPARNAAQVHCTLTTTTASQPWH
jgi:hypothetical protein